MLQGFERLQLIPRSNSSQVDPPALTVSRSSLQLQMSTPRPPIAAQESLLSRAMGRGPASSAAGSLVQEPNPTSPRIVQALPGMSSAIPSSWAPTPTDASSSARTPSYMAASSSSSAAAAVPPAVAARLIRYPVGLSRSSAHSSRATHGSFSSMQGSPSSIGSGMMPGTWSRITDLRATAASPFASSSFGSHASENSMTDAHGRSVEYWADPDVELKEAEFQDNMLANGLVVVEMPSDGVCLYRAIATCLSTTPETVHAATMAFIEQHAAYFAPFLSEPVPAYLARKRQLYLGDTGKVNTDAFGNHVELVAAACTHRCVINVHETEGELAAINPTECTELGSMDADAGVVHLWFHGGHYDLLLPLAGGDEEGMSLDMG
ncbi:hypothetical protein AMAG_18617 [Allomyces macrogynus ATCC 38327]|uniref:OTU domain-containing protein n=1 Tax=Allomyces macrogynus (strain ATCC 38327) TaxID=578462 RepID=A0A0L0SFZ3_ALLM3|nr:hypothetical protein AMAG_18617 [Allomyces macrogynus ATCC 38327]|eukprot:KNE61364.1 hypothetical protein AMAG_18617 [Allomyces macrogynus ATCC 38327]